MDAKQSIAFVSLDKDAIDLALQSDTYDIVGIFDKNPYSGYGDIPYLGPDESWVEVRSRFKGLKVVMLVDPPGLKRKLTEAYGVVNLAGLRASDSYVSSTVQLGQGFVIQLGVKILPDVKLGNACKINVNATIHHDCSVGNYCTLAPGCQLLGNVQIADEVFIGAGAIVLPKVNIGRGAVIGAGAVVASDVESGTTVVGVPAK
ncbi:MAG: acetyltransferase [Promethearchaeota archaeon]|jgi:sugar O-acyltransferase (sialic acid O-acetyltransferase NeuD family)